MRLTIILLCVAVAVSGCAHLQEPIAKSDVPREMGASTEKPIRKGEVLQEMVEALSRYDSILVRVVGEGGGGAFFDLRVTQGEKTRNLVESTDKDALAIVLDDQASIKLERETSGERKKREEDPALLSNWMKANDLLGEDESNPEISRWKVTFCTKLQTLGGQEKCIDPSTTDAVGMLFLSPGMSALAMWHIHLHEYPHSP